MSDIEPLYAVLGQRLRQERKRRDITQERVAERIGLPRSAVSHIEKGRQRLLVHTLLDYAQALDTTPAALLTDLVTAPQQGHVDLREVASDRPLKPNEQEFMTQLILNTSSTTPHRP